MHNLHLQKKKSFCFFFQKNSPKLLNDPCIFLAKKVYLSFTIKERERFTEGDSILNK